MTVGKIRKATRSEAKPLIGLFSLSGAGKTKSALLLARGFAGDTGRIAMIETEAGRGEVFADEIPGGYEVISIRDDFSPQAYSAALTEAEHAGVRAVIIDSASHEWEGLGGVLDQAAENMRNGKKSMLAWQGPKMDHAKHFMLRLLQTPIPLVIVCMRAKYPMEEAVGSNGKKEWRRSTDLEPKQSEDILFELMVHGWISPGDHNFHGTKYTSDSFRPVLRDGEPISIATGKRLAEYASGIGRKEAPPPIPTDAKPTTQDAQQQRLGDIARIEPSAGDKQFGWVERSLHTEKRQAVLDALTAKREEILAYRAMQAAERDEPPHNAKTGEVTGPDGMPDWEPTPEDPTPF